MHFICAFGYLTIDEHETQSHKLSCIFFFFTGIKRYIQTLSYIFIKLLKYHSFMQGSTDIMERHNQRKERNYWQLLPLTQKIL